MRFHDPVLLASLFTLVTTLPVQAQDLHWLNSESMGWDLNFQMPNHQVRTSPNGQVSATRGSGPSMAFGADIFSQVSVDRIDPETGLPIVTCTLADSVIIESMAVGSDGTTYVAGRFMGEILFCDGTTLGGPVGFLDTDLFLAALDSTSPTVLWVRDLSTAHPDGQHVPGLELDANGTLWYGLEEYSEVHLISVDGQGADDQEIIISGTRTLGGFAFDAWNNLYVTGSCEDNLGPLEFGGLSVPVTEVYGLFVLRIRADGSGHWAEIAHAETFHDPDIAVDPWGKAVISSGILDGTSFGDISFNGPNWVYDVFITQVDSTGEFLWGRESSPASGPIAGDVGQSRMQSLACDAAGNIYFTGNARGSTDWGNGVTSDVATMGVYAQTIVAFGNDGVPHWALTSNGGSINAQAVACDQAGAVYFTGHVNGPYEFGGMTVNEGGAQAFVDGRIDGLSTGVPSMVSAPVLSVWPIPASDHVSVRSSVQERGSFELISATGQVVGHGTLQAGINTIDLGALSAGVYTVRMASGGTARIVKD